MVVRLPRGITLLVLILLVVGGILGVRGASGYFYRQNFPKGYEETVRSCAENYQVDPCFVWAVIKTESGFQPEATSGVGARGLMQIMEDTFLWINTKIPGEGDTFDDMYLPEENIRYGTFLLSYLYQEFGSYETAAAAYHAGRTAVGGWLRDTRYSADGVTLKEIPIGDTDHYVNKVMKAYDIYCRLYGE